MTPRRSKSERTITAPRGAPGPRFGRPAANDALAVFDPDKLRPAAREEIFQVVMGAVFLGFMALIVCFSQGYLLLYGDAVAHLGIARRIVDSRNPGLLQLGSVWLPLPHLLILPFVQKMDWWQSGLAGAWPSLLCYVLGVAGFFRLCRRMLVPRWALLATAFYGLNPNLLYLSTTAMTEPLFLALMIWIVLMTVLCVDAIQAEQPSRVARRMIWLGVLIFAAVFTRYDGWVLGAAGWCVVAWQLAHAKEMWRRAAPAFAVFTLLAVAGPLLWLGYNQHFSHDPLDFMRGPYSAPAIEKRTSPQGSKHYRGWHNVGWALLFYTRAAQVVAAAWETGFAVMAAALAGLWIALRRRIARVSLLLWIPLAFYVYSVAYGSVPIFIPQLYPHSYYNARYGMELLPALALFACLAAAAMEQRIAKARAASADAASTTGGIFVRPLYLTVLVLVLLDPLAMAYGTSLVQQCARWIEHHPSNLLANYAPPLVLKEALVNSSTRVPFERNLALVLEDLPPGASILMQQSDHIGALQDAGIPLRQTINESDYDSWHAALQAPADHAAFVVAMAGDAVSKAVEQHPEELQELTILCSTGQPCARIYQSVHFAAAGSTGDK
ncbi:MAG: ArnT family glycosyltransferase [Acidobacteriaceae bacterium]